MKKPALGGSVLFRLSGIGSQIGRTQRLWILTAAMLLATALAGMLLIQIPWQERRRQMGMDLEEQKQRSELLLSIQRQKEFFDKAETELLFEGGTPALTGTVSRLASETQLAVESVSPKPDQVAAPYTQIQIEITATASLENLLRFLRSIEDHSPLLMLNEIEIGDNPAGGEWSGLSAPDSALPPAEVPKEQRVKMLISALNRTKKTK